MRFQNLQFHVLQQASTGFQSVELTLSITLKTKLTSYYAQRFANNWSCLMTLLQRRGEQDRIQLTSWQD